MPLDNYYVWAGGGRWCTPWNYIGQTTNIIIFSRGSLLPFIWLSKEPMIQKGWEPPLYRVKAVFCNKELIYLGSLLSPLSFHLSSSAAIAQLDTGSDPGFKNLNSPRNFGKLLHLSPSFCLFLCKRGMTASPTGCSEFNETALSTQCLACG